ncbi:MAG: chemotaxis protein CheW [Myxococcales bacterium]|nr:chemotaxis protein CheW [Myxococcales bacterium]MCB9550414.1 chemotaxis protein CheW [Myxococcales bacterium]
MAALAGHPAGRRFVVADVGPARFGLDVGDVLEVFALPPIARVPHAPAWVRGALVRGGRLVTVLDLGGFFGLDGCAPPTACVLVDDAELALAWAVAAVAVVEERDAVRSPSPRVALPDPGWIADSLCTPRFDFHRLDLPRVLTGVRERF